MFDDYSSEENSEESSISSDNCLNTDIDEDEFSKKVFFLINLVFLYFLVDKFESVRV